MSTHDTAAAGRVHVRSTARLKLIDEALRDRRCPSVKSLAALTERSERTVMRDLDALRRDFNAPLIYDSARRGWRYTEPGWTMPFQHFDAGEMLAFFTAAEVMRSTGHTPEAILLRAALAKLLAYLPPEVSANFAAISESLTFQPLPHDAALNHQTSPVPIGGALTGHAGARKHLRPSHRRQEHR